MQIQEQSLFANPKNRYDMDSVLYNFQILLMYKRPQELKLEIK